jgi:hypothetical protein
MSLFGVQGSLAGGVNRAYSQMIGINRAINDSLSKIERSTKRVQDDKNSYSAVGSSHLQMAGDHVKDIANSESLATLDSQHTLATGIADMVTQLRDLAQRKAGGESVGEEMTALGLAITAAVADETGNTAYAGMNGGGAGITVAASGIGVLNSASTVAALDTAVTSAVTRTATIDAARGYLDLANKSMAQRRDSHEYRIANLTAVNDASESVKITSLQMRQSAIAASVGIQNSVAANSAINLFG